MECSASNFDGDWKEIRQIVKINYTLKDRFKIFFKGCSWCELTFSFKSKDMEPDGFKAKCTKRLEP
jgi:hypothetical protein